jgi:hypothetical protein
MNVKKIRLYILIILSAVIIVFGYIKFKKFIEIDKCLDKGGSWNYKTDKCDCD